MKIASVPKYAYCRSEASVTGPYRPDKPVAMSPVPADVKYEQMLHAARIRQSIAVKPGLPPVPPSGNKPIPNTVKPSLARRILGLLGVGCAMGVVGGFLSIVALGPIGIGVALGMAALAALFIYASSKA